MSNTDTPYHAAPGEIDPLIETDPFLLGYQSGRRAERERCAKIAEACELEIISPGYAAARQDIAAAIRKSE